MKKISILVLLLASLGLAHLASANQPPPPPPPLHPHSDLQLVSMTVSSNRVNLGNNLTYTIVVKNNGPDNATNVTVLANPISPGVSYVSAGTVIVKNGVRVEEARSCQYAMHPSPPSPHDEVGCPIQKLDAGETATTTIVVTPTAVGNLHSRVFVWPDWGTIDPDFPSNIDPNIPSNNFDSRDVTVVAEEADLEVTMHDTPDPVVVLEDLSYAITVKNIGPSTAKNVTVTDWLPGYATYKSYTIFLVNNGSCQLRPPPNNSILDCDLGDIVSGDKAIIQVIVTPYKENIHIPNLAVATTSTREPVTANNRAEEDTTVVEPPPLPPPARCGDGHLDLPGEACDDGGTANGDGCSATCTVETGYSCSGSPSICNPICGDGLRTGSESCDDGNTANGDGCNSQCQIESPPPQPPPTGGGNSGGSSGGSGGNSGGDPGSVGDSGVPEGTVGVGAPGDTTSGNAGSKDLFAAGYAKGGGFGCSINRADARGFDPTILGLISLSLLPLVWMRVRKEKHM